MTVKLIFQISLILFLTACYPKEIFVIPEGDEQSDSKRLAVALSKKNFLTDFPVYSAAGIRINAKDYFRDIQNAHSQDVELLKASYPKAKELLFDLSSPLNGEKSKNVLIQSIALPYMRNLFLTQNTEENNKELAELLQLIMPTDPVDIDVLADAFVTAREHLPQALQNDYRSYLNKLYEQQKKEAVTGLSKAKKRLHKAETDDEKYGAIMTGKRFERMAESLAYVNKKLN